MADFYIKQNDTLPVIEAILKDGNGVPVDVTGATVKFNMRPSTSTTPKVSAASATIVSASTGRVKYTWGGSDTNTVGEFEGEFQVTFSGGTILTFPNVGYISISIADDIAS